jgi:hypothetical protein
MKTLEKVLYVKFIDDSDITIYEDLTCTIWRATKGYLANDLHNIATKDKTLKAGHLSIFYKLVTQLNEKHNIIIEIIDFVEIKSKLQQERFLQAV